MTPEPLRPLLILLKLLWRGMQAFTKGIGTFVAYLVMSAVYLSVVGPVSLSMRLFRPDPTDRGPGDPNAESYGRTLDLPPEDLKRAQRPY